MRVVRKGVFETNSSSSHSVSLISLNGTSGTWGKLPIVPKDMPTESIDIQGVRLDQAGTTVTEIGKLRIIVALVSEMIYYEWYEPLRKEWLAKNNNNKYDYNAWYAYYNIKKNQKGTINFCLGHRYWGYINKILKKRCNIAMNLYMKDNYPPFISKFVDYDLGCETDRNYTDLGFKLNMDRDAFKKLVEDIVFDNTVGIEQYTSPRNE